MKDIKSVLIGFLIASCMFLLMGHVKSGSQVGLYSLEINENYEYLVNTTNGELWEKT